MPVCAACGGDVAGSSRFCPHCGASADASAATRTTSGLADADALTVAHSGTASHPSIDHGALSPGETLAGRYRILSLLGRGGMGEVYRADDLTLGQPVALKFLPVSLDRDPSRLQRFLQEVRLARQISHPNVCRVYDIGDTGGRHFLSMEYIDGEDLASLLRRIGRLPPDKAVDIARQLCAGLAAAHDRGVLHRDLKPANVMLDGRGKVRLTDFGLAEIESPGGAGALAGTPAYMAPEQFDGQPATVKSDLYALGLVIHEIFTGKRVFDAPTIEGLRRQHRESSSRSLSSTIADVDPAVDRIVERCLERDPARRPASALAVAAALPGGDPLAAALAAGETPSPELVAAAGREGSLRPLVAIACLLVALAAAAATVVLSTSTQLFKKVSMPRSPDALVDRAQEILTRLGYTDPPADSASFMTFDPFYLRHIAQSDQTDSRWDGLETTPTVFLIYRQSPRELIALAPGGKVDARFPPEDVSGMVSVWVERQGRLVVLSAQPPQYVEATPGEPVDADWAAVFEEAGLDLAAFTPVDPKWVPSMAFDRRLAWEGTYPSTPAIPVHIEAASFMGRPVYFNIRGPWDVPLRQQVPTQTTRQLLGQAATFLIIVGFGLSALLLARRNWRARRGDPRGASRVAGFVFAVLMAAWVAGADHASDVQGELSLLVVALAMNLLIAAAVWVVYLALEPFVRRRWPHVLVGWTRALTGRLRDPLVGRDLLAGAAAGALAALLATSQVLLPHWLGQPPPVPGGSAPSVSFAIQQLGIGVYESLFTLFALLLLRLVLRRDWIAVGALLLGAAAVLVLQGSSIPRLVLALASVALVLGVLLRLGLLALTALNVVNNLLLNVPITFDPSAWYAPASAIAVLVVAALTAWGFHTALAGQPLLGRLLED